MTVTNETERVQADCRRAMILAAVQQVLFLFVFAVVDYEYGDLWLICFRTVPAFWSGVILIWLRRRQRPKAADLLFIRWGYFPLCVVAVFITKAFWAWRGLEWRGF
jgi:hypothetical protein